MTLKEMRQTRICGEQDIKCEGERHDHIVHYERIDHILYYEQVLGNVFEKRESKCCEELMKHRRKVKGEQVITVQMAQQ